MEKKQEKWVYETPVVKRIRVELEEVIAGSEDKSSVGNAQHVWTDEDINSDASGNDIIINL